MLIAGTEMNGNHAREGGGAIFDVVDTGWGVLRLNQSHLHHNISGQFQTFPGIYYEIDGKDTVPVMTKSTAQLTAPSEARPPTPYVCGRLPGPIRTEDGTAWLTGARRVSGMSRRRASDFGLRRSPCTSPWRTETRPGCPWGAGAGGSR